MLDIITLREVLRILQVLVEKALKDGYEQLALTKAILFSYMSSRMIAKCANCSHQAVGRVAAKFLSLSLPIPDFDALDNQALHILLYPHIHSRVSNKRPPPYELIIQEQSVTPKKYRKKLNLIYEAYYDEDPDTALCISQFYFLVRQHLKKSKLELSFEYEPGEIVYCDYAGMKASYIDRATGNSVQVYIFVAVLGYSKKMFAFATPNITAKDWVRGLVEAMHYFNGSPCVIHFDNGQLVKKAGRLAKLNEHIIPFSRYYNVICDTSRVASPCDNPNAEKSVQYIESQVLVAMRDQRFYGIEQINTFIREHVEKLNDKPIQRRGVSRNQLFYEHEEVALQSVPSEKYRPFDRRFKQKSAASCTIRFDNHEYSVPYKHRNQELIIEVAGDELRVIDSVNVIALHKVSAVRNGKTILPEHRHPRQKAEDNKVLSEFVKWAKVIGPSAVAIVKKQYEGKGSSRSRRAGKCCLELKRLVKVYKKEAFEQACKYAIDQDHQYDGDKDMLLPSSVELILQSGVYQSDDKQPDLLPAIAHHKNIRGSEFYRELR
jgi:hypothetical protein